MRGGEMDTLTIQDLDMLITSMGFTLQAFRDTSFGPHGTYPSYEFKCQRVAEAQAVMDKVRAIRRGLKHE